MMASSATSMLFPQLSAITNAAAAAAELFQFMDKPSELDPLSDVGIKPRNCHGAIELRNINFAYPARPTTQVLRGFSLSIPAGKTTALVGVSGGGKSTIIGLLERWYEPGSGKITIDGFDISKLNIKWLRTQIALVQQVIDMRLFSVSSSRISSRRQLYSKGQCS
jgi:ATP-binding cassette subfamily B (MDR/TAP) protein 1